MKAKIVILENHQEASRYAAEIAAQAFVKNPGMTVTFAAGDTPFACYHDLIQRQKDGQLQLTSALYIGLDEWIGLGPNNIGSCIASMNEGYYHPATIPEENILAFNGLTTDLDTEIERMQKILAERPLELAIVGVGVNGHIGFNEPESMLTGDFSLVPLSETTQNVGKKYFSGKATPTQGATITLQALKRARQVIILATGASKRSAVSSVLAMQPGLPVSAFLDHPGAVYIFDKAAAGEAE